MEATRVSLYLPDPVAVPAGAAVAWSENASGSNSLPFLTGFNGVQIRMGIPNTEYAVLVITNLDVGQVMFGWASWE